MLKVLWICNTPLPEIQDMFGIRNYNEGWLTGISNQLRNREDIIFHYAFPQNRFKKTAKKMNDGITFWGFYHRHKNPYEIQKEEKSDLSRMIKEINPDIIHIFGTEFAHSLECIFILLKNNYVIVSLQGLVSELAKVYTKGIPVKEQLTGKFAGNRYQCILTEKYEFYRRGRNETKVISNVKHVIGRTEWDKACTKKINPVCRYYHCNETLRDVFYEGSWNIENIQRYSIFISQGNYPIKGLHVLLSALPLIKKAYPDVKVYVAGNRAFLKEDTPYGHFINKMIKKYNVEKNIVFVGLLTGEKVKQRLLKAHVALMPSLLENSPNSIGEAMILGVPVVASNVGGIPTLLQDRVEGYLYPCMNEKSMAKRICKIFANDYLALRFSKNGRKMAELLYDKSRNLEQLLEIYSEIRKDG